MIFVGILVSIIIFSIIVLLHEYGHYKTAKLFGIHVEEFGLGIPPRAKKLWRNKDGTLFSLNWIPLGGFVKIAGESEKTFHFYSGKGKNLSLKELEKRLEKHQDIYDIFGKEIEKIERKMIQSHLSQYKSGHNFFEKNIFQKTAVLIAGVVMNFILAGIILSVLFFIGVKPVGINTIIPTTLPSKIIPTLEQSIIDGIIILEQGTVLFPVENSLAEQSGIRQGDILLRVNDINFSEISDLQKYIQESKNQTLNFYIQRKIACEENDLSKSNCPIIELLEIKIPLGEDGKIGSYLSPNYVIQEDFTYKFGVLESMRYGFQETYYQSVLTLSGLKILLKNIINPETPQEREEALNQVAGPIGIVGVITQSLAGGFSLLMILAALISINLGVFNILPIPALDGGRILFLWIRTVLEALFGKKTSFQTIENITHIAFFLLLIALSVLIAYNDIIKLFSN